MSAEKLLKQIESQGLLPASTIAQLWKQIQANPDVQPEKITKLLIGKGQLTEFQANTLLSQISADTSPASEENLLVLDDSQEEIGLAEDDEEIGLAEDDEEIGLAAEDDEILGDVVLGEDAVLIDDDAVLDDAILDDDAVVIDDGAVIIEDSADAVEVGAPPPVPATKPNAEPDLLDDSLINEADARMGTSLPPRPRGLASIFGGKRSPNKWDSPLLLIGGGGLLLLVIALVSLIFLLRFDSGDDIFKKAEDDFRGASYSQAIAGYNDFLKRFPKHPNASQARVRSGIAQIRQLTDHSKDWPGALAASERLLPEIKNEGAAFESAHNDLASILPSILEGFASEAADTNDLEKKRQLVDGSSRALALVTNPEFMPSSLRKTRQSLIDASLEKIETVKWSINRDSQLEATIATVEESIANSDLQAAYTAREKLLASYPGLRQDSKLATVTSALAAAEHQQVKPISEPPKASTKDHDVISHFKVVLANRVGDEISSLRGYVVYVMVRGSVFALDAATGEVLWRRYVGRQTTANPIPIGSLKASDALIVDANRHELLRLDHQTGALVWRLPCPGQISAPVIPRNQQLAIVGSKLGTSSQLLLVNLGSGAVEAAVELPRTISTPATVDTENGLVFQIADEGSLFVLQLANLKSVSAVPLDHGAGSVLAPPLPVGGAVLIAENVGAQHSTIRVVAPIRREESIQWQTIGKSVRLEGHVSSPMISNDRRAVIATDRGAIYAFEVDLGKSEPLNQLAKVDAIRAEPQISFALFDSTSLWLADRQLSKYELQLSRGRLVRKSIQDQRDIFVAPLQVIQDTLFDVRRIEGQQSTTVSAIQFQVSQEANRVWQTTLAPALAGEVLIDNKRVLVTSADAQLYTIGASGLRSGRVNSATSKIDGTARLRERLDVGSRTIFLDEASGKMVTLNRAAPALALSSLQLSGQANATPIPFGKGILIPTDAGTVDYIDPSSGKPISRPFQPTLSTSEAIHWIGPTSVPDENQFVVADQTGRRFRVGIAQQPKLHLKAINEATSTRNFVGNLAATVDTVYAVARDADFDFVIAMNAGDLAEAGDWRMEGRVSWGPFAVGDVVMVATTNDQLFCFTAAAKLHWQAKGPAGGIAGRPILIGDEILVAGSLGSITRVSLADGGETAKLEVGEPLSAGPTLFGKRCLVPSHDGTIHVVDLPE